MNSMMVYKNGINTLISGKPLGLLGALKMGGEKQSDRTARLPVETASRFDEYTGLA